MIRETMNALLAGKSLTTEQAEQVMDEIMSGDATPAQIAGFLIALRLKGETPDEIAGCARAMRNAAVSVCPERTDVIDTCGTGGDRAGTFNISTTTAFVVAGAGLGVAKHGNRSVSSRSGSADADAVVSRLGRRVRDCAAGCAARGEAAAELLPLRVAATQGALPRRRPPRM